MNLLLVVSIAGGVIGMVVFLIGWIGRRLHDHPTCRGCKYDLSGVWPESARCPECGADITIAKAVSRGFREKRRGLVLIGLFIFLTGSAGTGTAIWPWVKSISSWHELKPDWWLVLEAQSGNPLTVERAVKSLNPRFEADALSKRQIQTLLEYGLAAQADRKQRWIIDWGNLIEYAWHAEEMTLEQKARYLKNAVEHELVMRDSVVVGGDVSIRIRTLMVRTGDRKSIGMGSSDSTEVGSVLLAMMGPRNMMIDNKPVNRTGRISTMKWHQSVAKVSPTMGGWTWKDWDGKIGEHTLTLEMVMWGGLLNVPGASKRISAGEDDVTFPIVRTPLTGTFRVVSAEEEKLKRLISDASLSGVIGETFSLNKLSMHRGSDRRLRLTGQFETRPPPMAVAFEVFLRNRTGQEWRLGDFVSKGPGSITTYQYAFDEPIEGYAGGLVEIILRSNWDLVGSNLEIEKIWGGEIVLPGIVLPALPAEAEAADDLEGG